MASTAANREDGGNQDQVMEGYLQRILRARVYEVARETPLEPATRLSQRLGHSVLLKREDLQPVFSFKLRGAFNKMVQLPPEQLQRGVIAASAGNHAQGVALAAERLGCSAGSCTILLKAPRSLKEKTGCRSSRFSSTEWPRRCDRRVAGSSGVSRATS